MPWRGEGISLGFSAVDGWLPSEASHASKAIDVQEKDAASFLNHTKALISLRQSEPALKLGEWETISGSEQSLIFRRRLGNESLVCGFNWGDDPIKADLSGALLAGRCEAGFIGADSYAIVKERL